MTGIVSAAGLGLFNSSLATLGARGAGLGTAGIGSAREGAFVNIANGNLVLQRQDDQLVAQGLDLSVLRTYNSQGQGGDDNGDNWQIGFYRQVYGLTGTVNTAGSTVKRLEGDGSVSTFTYDVATSSYLSSDGSGAFDTLTFDGSANTWTFVDGSSRTVEAYDNAHGGRIQSAADPDGVQTVFGYDVNGRLTSVTSDSGESVSLVYTGANLTEVRFSLGQSGPVTTTRVRYEYDAQNRLSRVITDLSPEDGSVSDGNSYWVAYTYDGSSTRVATLTQSDGTSMSMGYTSVDGDMRLTSLTDGLGRTTTYAYDVAQRKTTVTDPLGNATVYGYDAAGQLESIVTPSGSGVDTTTTTFAYDAKGNVTSVTDALGRQTVFTYDAHGNQLSQEDAAGNRIERSYDAANQVLAESIRNTAVVDGSPQTEWLTTRRVYDSEQHLRFVVSAEGRVTEYRYSADGNLTSTLSYAGNSFDASGLARDQAPSLSAMTTWLATADAADALRTDLSYDFRGQLATSTTYGTLDAAGVGVSASASVTHYSYDAAGRLIGTIDGASNATAYTYDGLGRLLTTLDARSHTSSTSYDAAGNQIVTSAPNGLLTTSTYDAAGELVSVVQTQDATTLSSMTYTYDEAGRLRSSTNGAGQTSYILFDAAGRHVADINAAGVMTEYRYNALDQLIEAIGYRNPLAAWQLEDLGDNPIVADLASFRPDVDFYNDQRQWNLYDDAGRLAASVDAVGHVTRNFFDGASRVIRSTGYATPIDTTTLSDPPSLDDLASLVESPYEDRSTLFFYDDDGLLLGTLGAEQNLVRNEYDDAGRLVRTIAYAQRVGNVPPDDDGVDQAAQLDALTPTASFGFDIEDRYRYDDAGRLIAHVDGEQYVTTYSYDGAGNRIGQTRFATQGTSVDSPATSIDDQHWTYSYSPTNQLASELGPDGTITTYSYDAVGKLLSTSVTADAQTRTATAQRDALGRVIAELSSRGALALQSASNQTEVDAVWAQYGTRYTYDVAGHQTSATDAAGNRTTFFYDEAGRLIFSINAKGEVTGTTYTSFGQVESRVQYARRLDASVVTGLAGGAVDASLNTALLNLNDSRDQETDYFYDTRNLLNQVTDKLGNVTSYAYDGFGDRTELSHSTEADPYTASYEFFNFDRAGRQTFDSVGSWDGQPERRGSTSYDAFGRVTVTGDGNGYGTAYQYDRLGRQILVATPQGQSQSFTYDAFDQRLTATDGNFKTTTFSYDLATHSVTSTSPEGVSVVSSANAFGQVTSVKDGNNHTTHYEYDLDGNLLRVYDALGTLSADEYDSADRLVSTTDARGIVTTFSYDAANRVMTRTEDPTGLALSTDYTYDALGRQILITDARQITTATHYDLAGRVSSIVVDAGGSAEHLNLTTHFEYDASGNQTAVTDPNGNTTHYQYNDSGWLVQKTDALGKSTVYDYDWNGNVTKVTDPLGASTYYAYDNDNRLVYTADALGSLTKNVYDDNGRVVQTTHYAHAIAIPSEELSLADSAAAVVADAGHDTAQRFIYDDDGRLVFTLDAIGSTATAIGVADEPGTVTTAGYSVTERVYDGNGNVVRRIAYANAVTPIALTEAAVHSAVAAAAAATRDEGVTNVYDARNRLEASVDTAGAVRTYAYDDGGNVIESVAYAQAIANPQAIAVTVTKAELLANVTADASTDVHARMVYDAAGRLVARADSHSVKDFVLTWSVEHFQYDRNGNVTGSVRSSTLVSSSTLIADPTQADVKAWIDAVPLDRGRDDIEYFVYDGANRRTVAVDGEGAATRTVYDDVGHVIRTIGYSHALSLSGVVDASVIEGAIHPDAQTDRVSNYVYDEVGRLRFSIDAEGAVTERRYSDAGFAIADIAYANRSDLDLLAAYSAYSVTHSFAADAALDRVTQYYVDAAGQTRYARNGEGYVTRYDYDIAGRTVRTIQYRDAHPDGDMASIAAQFGLGTAPEVADGASEPDYYGFDGSRATRYKYDAQGRLVATISADRQVEVYEYDALGNRVAFTNKAGSRWTYDFDAAGRLVAEHTPQVLVAFNPAVIEGDNGPVLSDVQPPTMMSLTTRYVYDALGNVMHRIEADGNFQSRDTYYTYDAAGRQVGTHNYIGQIYDDLSDPLTDDGAEGGLDRYEYGTVVSSTVVYDALGNAIHSTGIGGSVSSKIYDRMGRVVYEIGSDRAVTGYERNAFGEVTSLYRYVGDIAAAELATPIQGVSSAGYLGAPITAPSAIRTVDGSTSASVVDRVIKTSYDRLGQVVQVMSPIAYVHIESTQEEVAADLAKTVQYRFDAFGEVVREVTFGADADGVRRTGLTSIVNHFFDQRGQEIATTQSVEDGFAYVTRFERDAVGNVLARREFATPQNQNLFGAFELDVDSLVTSDDDRTTSYTYDALNRTLTETLAVRRRDVVDGAAATEVAQTTRYFYNELGNLRATQDARGAVSSQTYDALGRITSVQGPDFSTRSYVPNDPFNYSDTLTHRITSFIRDAYGNVVQSNVVSESLDPYAGIWSTIADTGRVNSFWYDDNGRLMAQSDASNHLIQYSYDIYGRLAKQWQTVGGQDEAYQQVSYALYTYNPAGRVTSMSTPGNTGRTTYTYNRFGELMTTKVGGVIVGQNSYDNAGNLTSTTADGGVRTLKVYDLEGRETVELTGETIEATLGGLKAVDQSYAARRTDWRYDDLGHVIETRSPYRNSVGAASFGVSANPGVVASTGNVTESEGAPLVTNTGHVPPQWSSPVGASFETVSVSYQWVSQATFDGYDGDGQPIWSGSNVVEVHFSGADTPLLVDFDRFMNVAVPGIGQYGDSTFMILMIYEGSDPSVKTISWIGDPGDELHFEDGFKLIGIPHDYSNEEIPLLDSTAPQRLLTVPKPADLDGELVLRVNGQNVPMAELADSFVADVQAYPVDAEYELRIKHPDGSFSAYSTLPAGESDDGGSGSTPGVGTAQYSLQVNVISQATISGYDGDGQPIWDGENRVELTMSGDGINPLLAGDNNPLWLYIPGLYEGSPVSYGFTWEDYDADPYKHVVTWSGDPATYDFSSELTVNGTVLIGPGQYAEVTLLDSAAPQDLLTVQRSPVVDGQVILQVGGQEIDFATIDDYFVANVTGLDLSGGYAVVVRHPDGSTEPYVASGGSVPDGGAIQAADYGLDYEVVSQATLVGYDTDGNAIWDGVNEVDVHLSGSAVPLLGTGAHELWMYVHGQYEGGPMDYGMVFEDDDGDPFTHKVIWDGDPATYHFADGITLQGAGLDGDGVQVGVDLATSTGTQRILTIPKPTGINGTLVLEVEGDVVPLVELNYVFAANLSAYAPDVEYQLYVRNGSGQLTPYDPNGTGDEGGEGDEGGPGDEPPLDTSPYVSPIGSWVVDTDNGRPTVHQTVDRWGNITAQADARWAELVTRYTYNSRNQVVEVDHPGYDALGYEDVERYDYDLGGNLVAAKDANGNVTRFDYDEAGHQITETAFDTANVAHVVSQSGYDSLGQLTQSVDGLGRVTGYGYDVLGRLASTTSAAYQHYIVDVQTLSAGDFKSDVTTYDYDALGRRTRVHDANGGLTATRYDYAGHILATTDPTGANTSYGYDSFGHRNSEITADGHGSSQVNDAWGRALVSYDQENRQTTYTYNGFGEVTSEDLAGVGVTTYSYDEAGQLVLKDEAATARQTHYEYSLTGQTVREKTTIDGTVYQDNWIGYNDRDQMAYVSDGRHTLVFGYDGNGNRIHQTVHYVNDDNTEQNLEYWYAYDWGNRQTIVDGVRNSSTGVIDIGATQGQRVTYDDAGQRVSVTKNGRNLHVEHDEGFRTNYEGVEYVVIEVAPGSFEFADGMAGLNGAAVPPESVYRIDTTVMSTIAGEETEAYGYDEVGNLTTIGRVASTNQGSGSEFVETESRYYTSGGRMVAQLASESMADVYQEGTVDGVVSYTTRSGAWDAMTAMGLSTDRRFITYAAGTSLQVDIITRTTRSTALGQDWNFQYDAFGNVTDYQHYQGGLGDGHEYTLTYHNGYAIYGNQNVQVSARITNEHGDYSQTQLVRDDANGELVQAIVPQSSGGPITYTYKNASSGQVLQRIEGSGPDATRQYNLVVLGNVLGTTGNDVTDSQALAAGAAPFNIAFTATPQGSKGVATTYVAHTGDTPRNIAQRVYGDGSLWYRIVQANGLAADPDAGLQEGTVLSLPTALTSKNDASTYRPYDPSVETGNIGPQLPQPSGHHGCGAFGQFLVAAVVIAVAYFTAQWYLAPEAATVGAGTAAAAGTGATAAAGATYSAGELAVAGAVGGAAGSVAGQVVANIIGVQDGFSFKEVLATSAAYAVGNAFGGSELDSTFGKSVVGTSARAATAAAITGATSQGVRIALNLQSSFSWQQVAASAIAAPVAQFAGGAVAGQLPAGTSDLSRAIVNGIASGTTQEAIVAVTTGGKFRYQNVATDAFGNVLANGYKRAPATAADNLLQPAPQSDSSYGDETESSASSHEDPILADGSSGGSNAPIGNYSGPAANLSQGAQQTVFSVPSSNIQGPPVDDGAGYSFVDANGRVVVVAPRIDVADREDWDFAPRDQSVGPAPGPTSSSSSLFQFGPGISPLPARVLGGAVGVAHSIFNGIEAGVGIAGRSTLMIGDILTLYMNHDSEIMQDAWVTQGAMASNAIDAVSDLGRTKDRILQSLQDRLDASQALRASGDEFGAARLNGELGADLAQAGEIGLGLARGGAKLGGVLLDEALSGPVAGSRAAQRGSINIGPVDAGTARTIPVDNVDAAASSMSGPVVFKAPPNATPEQLAQFRAYVDGSNEALAAGYISPTGRVSTAGELRIDASLSAAEERAAAVEAGTPYQGHVGHVPDTTWTGMPTPYAWLDLDPVVNSSLGAQARWYPIGYKPTGFIFKP